MATGTKTAMRTVNLKLLLLAGLTLACGCGPYTPPPERIGNPSGSGSSGSSATSTSTSGSDDAGPQPQCASSCSAVTNEACNSITQQGSCIATTVAPDTHDFTGGTISPGTYVLESMTFDAAPPTDFTFALTVDVIQTSPGGYDLELFQSLASCPEVRRSYSFVTSGDRFTSSQTCPAPCSGSVSCGETSQFRVDSPCRFTLNGGFGYLQELHFVKASGCGP